MHQFGDFMTCIVGLIDGNRVWMGGDSAGVSGLDITVRSDPKVFRNGDFLIGFTSSFRMGQLLAFRLRPPPRPEAVIASEAQAARKCEAIPLDVGAEIPSARLRSFLPIPRNDGRG